MSNLPIIDLRGYLSSSLEARRHLASLIHDAIRNDGFFYLINHGLDENITACFKAAKWFFDLPPSTKQTISIHNSPCHRGWYKLGGEVLDAQNHPEGDHKEGIKIGQELDANHPFVKQGLPLHGANQWLATSLEGAPEFQATMQAGYQNFSQLGKKLMQALALGLDIEESYFNKFLKTPMATLSPIHYPPLEADTASFETISAGAHTDFGCLSLLGQDTQQALEIQRDDGTWQPVAPLENSLVVNIGDMMEFWTNGYYHSTRHRVRNTNKTERYSLVFFYDPQFDTLLTPIKSPRICADMHNNKEESLTALNHLLNKIDKSFNYKSFND